jgi:nucleoside-diphosphate-sugar epimerase
MKILVTGATGFIGNYVITELLKKNIEVIASSTNIEKAKTFDWYSNVSFIPFNLKEFNSSTNYFEYFNCPDTLIHLAWEGLPNYKDSFHIEENLPRHFNFLENLITNGLKDINITGTCFEYGMKEGCLTEDMECNPTNAYAIAKNELRIALEKFQKGFNFDFKWIRLFYMYGKGQSANSLFSQLDKALENNDAVFNMSGGEQERDYLKVEQVANYIVAISLQREFRGVINCCSGIPIKIKDFVAAYLNVKNKKIALDLSFYPYTDYEPMRFWGDRNKLNRINKNASSR